MVVLRLLSDLAGRWAKRDQRRYSKLNELNLTPRLPELVALQPAATAKPMVADTVGIGVQSESEYARNMPVLG